MEAVTEHQSNLDRRGRASSKEEGGFAIEKQIEQMHTYIAQLGEMVTRPMIDKKYSPSSSEDIDSEKFTVLAKKLKEQFQKFVEQPIDASLKNKLLLEIAEQIIKTPLLPQGTDFEEWEVIGRLDQGYKTGIEIVKKVFQYLSSQKSLDLTVSEALITLLEAEPVLNGRAADHAADVVEPYVLPIFLRLCSERDLPNYADYDELLASWLMMIRKSDPNRGRVLCQRYFGANLLMDVFPLGPSLDNEVSESLLINTSRYRSDRDTRYTDGLGHTHLTSTRALLFESVFSTDERLSAEQTDVMLAWTEKEDEAYLYRQEIAEILRRGNQEHIRRSLERIRVTADLPFARETALSLLRRLDLGDVPVGGDGVTYLGNNYDLQAENSRDAVVRRLTSEGEVAIFDGERRLTKVFTIEPGEKRQVIPELRMCSIDEVVLPAIAGENENDRARRYEQFLAKIHSYMTEEFFGRQGSIRRIFP